MTESGPQPPPPPHYVQPLPPPQQPYGAPPGGGRRNGLGTTALVLGILAVLLSFTVVLIVVALPLAVVALVLGLVGRARAKRGQADNGGVATAGLVLGVLGLVLSVAIGLAAGSAVLRLVNSPEGQRLQECVASAQGDQARVQACQEQFARDARG